MENFIADMLPMFQWLIKTTIHSSILIGIILLIKLAIGNRLAARWHYCLWLLLIIRMVFPQLPQTSLSIFNLLPQKAVEVSYQPSIVEAANDETAMPIYMPAVNESGQMSTVIERPTQRQEIDEAAISFSQLLPIVWLAGAILIAVYIIISNYLYWRGVYRQRPMTDGKILNLLEDCKSTMGINTIVAVIATDRISSPALFGYIRPRLLLPKKMLDSLSAEDLRYIFMHELAHLKRNDILMGWLMSVLQVLHWFNPLVWFAFGRMRADRELACDSLTLSSLEDNQNKRYGHTIVSLLERYSQRRYLPSMAGILEDKSQLKRRIKMISQFKKKSTRITVLAAAVLMCFGFVALTNAKQANKSDADVQTNPQQLAKQFVGYLLKDDYASAVKQFDKTMTKAMSADTLKQAWQGILSQAGAYQKQLGIREQSFLATKIIFITAQFEQGPLDIKTVYDKTGKMSGLWFVPTPDDVLKGYRDKEKKQFDEKEKKGYKIKFSPAEYEKHKNRQSLLELFNQYQPEDVKTFRFKFETQNGKAIGSICTDTEAGKDKIVQMIKNNEQFKLVEVIEPNQKKVPTDAEKKASKLLNSTGWKLWRQRKLAEAEEKFQLAVEKDPANVDAWNGLGWSQFNQGDSANAEEAFKKCMELEPAHAAALNGLGWINKNNGNTEKAIEYWEKAVERTPNATAALGGLTQTYMEQKKYAKAAKYYQKWLKAEPNNDQAKQGLEKAKKQIGAVKNGNGNTSNAENRFDLSTPKAAYKSINEVFASGKAKLWKAVSTKDIGDRINSDNKVDRELAKVLKNAEILDVRTTNNIYAVVVARLPQEFSSKTIRKPIDVRYLEKENGRWLNAGNDRVDTVQQAIELFDKKYVHKQKATKNSNGNTSDVEDIYTIKFSAKNSHRYNTRGKLLKLFNEKRSKGVKTFKMKANLENGKLIGSICTDTEAGKDKIVQMLHRNRELELVDIIMPKEAGSSFGSDFPIAAEKILSYISDKHLDLYQKAAKQNLRCNTHIYTVNDDFEKMCGGLLGYKNRTTRTISSEISIATFGYSEFKLYDESGNPQNYRIVKQKPSKGEGKYKMFWTPDRPVVPGEMRLLCYMHNAVQKLNSDKKGICSLTMQNYYGSPVIENFFLVIPTDMAIVSATKDFVSRENFGDFDVYLWSRKVKSNTNNKVDVKLTITQGINPRAITKKILSPNPQIVETNPVAFSTDVSSELDKITVTFDRPMKNGSWSWTGGGETFPETIGRPFYDKTKTKCTIKVKLKPGKVYWIGINSPSHKNFKSEDGISVQRYVILFATADRNGNPTPIPNDMLSRAKRINSVHKHIQNDNDTKST